MGRATGAASSGLGAALAQNMAPVLSRTLSPQSPRKRSLCQASETGSPRSPPPGPRSRVVCDLGYADARGAQAVSARAPAVSTTSELVGSAVDQFIASHAESEAAPRRTA